MKLRIQIGLLLVGLLACKEQTTQPGWADPYERWRSLNLHNYTIDQIRMCFCPDAGQVMRLTVRSDTIALVVRLSDSSKTPYPMSTFFLTVDSLFSIIRNPNSDSLGVEYNAEYGYPEKLDINPQLHPVDGGVLYLTSNLRIL